MEFYSKYIDKLTHLSILFDLVHPENGPLSIKWLPNYILKPILDKIELKNIDYGPKVKIHLDNLKGYIQEALVVDEKLKLEKLKQTKHEVVSFDINRNQSYKDYLDPELVKLLNSISI